MSLKKEAAIIRNPFFGFESMSNEIQSNFSNLVILLILWDFIPCVCRTVGPFSISNYN